MASSHRSVTDSGDWPKFESIAKRSTINGQSRIARFRQAPAASTAISSVTAVQRFNNPTVTCRWETSTKTAIRRPGSQFPTANVAPKRPASFAVTSSHFRPQHQNQHRFPDQRTSKTCDRTTNFGWSVAHYFSDATGRFYAPSSWIRQSFFLP